MGYHSAHGPPEEARHWEQFAQAALDRLGENGELRAIFHNNRGLALYQEGNFAEAYEAFDKAFALAEHTLGAANAMTLRYATNSVAALGNLDRIDETQRAFEMLVHLGETNLGPLHPFLSQPLSNLSNFYAFQGRFADARRLLDRVRVIGQQAYGARSEEWAQFHIAYGDLEASEGHDTEALGHYEEAAHLFRELTGAESLELLQALVKEADARTELGQLAPAQRTYQQVLELTKKDPRQYAQVQTQALAGLADLNDARGQHEQALHLRQQALELRERDLGPEHIHTALMRVAIASSYLELGDPERAGALRQGAGLLREDVERGLALGRAAAGGQGRGPAATGQGRRGPSAARTRAAHHRDPSHAPGVHRLRAGRSRALALGHPATSGARLEARHGRPRHLLPLAHPPRQRAGRAGQTAAAARPPGAHPLWLARPGPC
ncbi:tetratricopeptide repeat protein [Cystobacter fuscus]